MKFQNSMLIRLVSICLILTFPIQSIAASKGIFLPLSSAKKIVVELEYCKSNSNFYSSKYNFCDQERTNLSQQKEVLQLKNNGLESDKELLTKANEEYKNKYIETNRQLVESQESKPSRLTWFGVGFLSALVVTLAIAFTAK